MLGSGKRQTVKLNCRRESGRLLFRPGRHGLAGPAALTGGGGYIIAGETNSSGAGDYGVYLVKVGAAGKIEWEKTFGGSGWDAGKSVRQTEDGGYLVPGGRTPPAAAASLSIWSRPVPTAGNSGRRL
ncbi:MAG: hypothetical protein AB1523_13935 [Bacillota bacterium]